MQNIAQMANVKKVDALATWLDHTREAKKEINWPCVWHAADECSKTGLTLVKPISLEYSRKHCLQMLSPYFRMSPHWLLQTRLQKETRVKTNRQQRTSPPAQELRCSPLARSLAIACWVRVPDVRVTHLESWREQAGDSKGADAPKCASLPQVADSCLLRRLCASPSRRSEVIEGR